MKGRWGGAAVRVWITGKVISCQGRDGMGEGYDGEYSRGCDEVPFFQRDMLETRDSSHLVLLHNE